ncbi:phosphotransferase family protein [Streptomyces fulvoviolaceus]|uniref:phosphotransferase family protein n=1 Tax=Streptomyces fulvoviolaceus TaxID=285535 RepID=UPI001F259C37|nr:phosphotransferase [Streptomyces fulvoviolaceus]MCT9084594.1 phosphotransferase [Streptomyces fulvoviolaceus]
MTDHDEAAAVRPLTLAWVSRHLEAGERIVRTEALHGGITAEIRRLTVGTRDGGTRDLVLRTFTDPFFVEHAEDWLNREAGALTLLTGTGVPAPGLVAVDPTAAQCAYPSLLMTHLAGRTVLDDEGVETRLPVLARQLVAIHALRPAERPREYAGTLPRLHRHRRDPRMPLRADELDGGLQVVPPAGWFRGMWPAAVLDVLFAGSSVVGLVVGDQEYSGNLLGVLDGEPVVARGVTVRPGRLGRMDRLTRQRHVLFIDRAGVSTAGPDTSSVPS